MYSTATLPQTNYPLPTFHSTLFPRFHPKYNVRDSRYGAGIVKSVSLLPALTRIANVSVLTSSAH